jgi:hypothetical protein
MSLDIDYTVAVRVPDGPQLQVKDTLAADCIDVHDVVVAKNAGTAEIALQPGYADDVVFLSMYSDNYTSLTVEFDDSGTTLDFDGPMMLIGPGAVVLTGVPNVALFTNNGTAAAANIRIVIGRHNEYQAPG